ncbi:NACHT, LRR and PYD domains-containing protein 12 isoform X3, partial [Silurus meridionalis]
KEEYFRKRISDQCLANKIITHMKSSRSLYIMCHIPVFCWISATVLERMLGEAETGEIPKTLTQMFLHFLIFQIKHKDQKYHQKCDPVPQQTRESILALGKLAFQQLEKGNLIFYEEDLRECGIDVREASVYSGVCTQIFREEFGFHLGKVFSFVHLSVQEFLAALYTFLSFINKKSKKQQINNLSNIFTKSNMSAFLRSAVKKALQSENGHLDLFLRFLLGLSLESNQTLLRDLLPQTGSSSYSKQETIEYIKKKIRENPSPEKSINLFHCLNELNDDSLEQEVQRYLNSSNSRCLSGVRLSPAQWSALVFVLLNSEENLDEFDLSKYDGSDECLLRLLPVVKASRKAELCYCNLTEESCKILSSVLSSNSSSLRELDLSGNKLQDSGVKLLSAGLENPHCTLEILRLYWCNLTDESCRILSSVLSSNSSSPRELNLNRNKLQDSGVKLLSAGLENPHCTLEILRLERCSITGEGCAALVSALRSNTSSHLRELHLNYNKAEESGMKLLSDLLKDPHCKLETLQVYILFFFLSELVSVHQRKLKSKLREKCKRITEGISQHGSSALLNEIYTDLYITEGWSGDVNNEHEVRQIETVSRRPATQETPIKCTDLFKGKSFRSVLTKGVAGIGKTVSVQKFILDWAEGKANQDVTFMFPLPFRELNLIKQKPLSLMGLLHHFFPEIKELRLIDCERNKVVLIFDGLDECRLPLNFQNNERLCDVTESASVDVLLTNLIKGNLLPSALLWITSRPGAANQIPPECVDQVTEVRGFSDPQKEEYFRKRISDQSLANKIITHMKSSRSLYIMCHIPVFCWISATVLERMLGEAESGEIPKTLTQMFTHFLIFQIKHKHLKYHQKCDPDPQQTRESILALGKLAFQQLEKGNLIFYEEDLRECGIDVREASVYSGVCTQIFREEFGLHLGKVFSFVHLSVQEFLAALYTFLSFINKKSTKKQINNLSDLFTKSNMSDFLRCAVDKTLQSENGHLDLFLRFLLGLSLEANQILLRDLLPQTGSSSHSKQETVEYIKKKIRENPSPEKSINLFHCLNELNDDSLVQEVQRYLNSSNSRCLSGVRLSPAQWSALVFVLLNSEENLDVFNLRKYDGSDECLLRLLPVVKASRKAELCDCNLTEESCRILSSVLSSNSSSLRELDLSNNNLQDSGVKLLSAGLENPHCTLEILRFESCSITGEGCAALVSALRSNTSSHLRELNLNYNKPGDSGVKLLSDLLKDPHCKLETLQLVRCSVTGEGCAALVSALRSNTSSHLRELNLNYNEPGDSGVKLLSDLLKDPHCKLETL